MAMTLLDWLSDPKVGETEIVDWDGKPMACVVESDGWFTLQPLEAKMSDALKEVMQASDDGMPMSGQPQNQMHITPKAPEGTEIAPTDIFAEEEKHKRFDPERVWKAIEDICKGRG